MPTLPFTDVSIRSLAAPEKGSITYWDTTLKGFGCRISQGGAKTFIVMQGVQRRRTKIGRYPAIKLADARTEAKRLIAEYVLGKSRPKSIDFDEAIRRFLEVSAQKNRPRTTRDYNRLLNRHFRFGRTQMRDITTEDLMRRIRKLANTPSEQNHAFRAARVLFSWAIRENYVAHSPLASQQLPAPINVRERVLNERELALVYNAAKMFPYPYGAIVTLLILTGQRRSEVGALEWDWIDTDERLIRLPASITKNKSSHTFPYGELVNDILQDLPHIHNQYVFPASRTHIRGKPTTSYNGWAKTKPKFDATLDGVEPFTLHDLRRTFSSTLAKLGTPLHVTEKILNHKSGSISGVAAVYNQYSYLDEQRQAIKALDEYLVSITQNC